MKCSQVQDQTHKYLEDLLSETVRSEIQSHTADCSACGDFLARQDHLSVDLKRNYFSPCPFNLVPILEAAIALKNQRPDFTGRRKAMMIGLLIAGFLLTWQYRALWAYIKNHPYSLFSSEPKPALEPEPKSKLKSKAKKVQAKAALKKLTQMSDTLQGPFLTPAEVPLKTEPQEPVKKIVSYVKKACVEDECSELEVSE